MKFLLIATLLVSGKLIAQECSNYFFLQNAKTVEMTVYNKKGDAHGRQIYAIHDVKNNGGSMTSALNTKFIDKKGKTVSEGTGKVQCKDGIMLVDMKMSLPQQTTQQIAKADVKADDFYIEYPHSMQPGDHLKDANMNMEVDNGGMKQSITMVVNDRKVEAKEKVTTPAGSWDCYKISFKSKITVKMMGVGMPMNIDGYEWFAPGFGIVKTETKQGGTEITAVK